MTESSHYLIAKIARSNFRQTQLLSSMRKDVGHPELMLKKLFNEVMLVKKSKLILLFILIKLPQLQSWNRTCRRYGELDIKVTKKTVGQYSTHGITTVTT